MDSPDSAFLKLPPEIRLNIYEYALPDEILLKTWRLRDVQGPIHKCAYQIYQPPKHHTPYFILTCRTVFYEVAPLIWARAVLDRTLYYTDSWHDNGPHSHRTIHRKRSIYIPERFAIQIRHIILPISGGQYLNDPLDPFPCLQTVTIHVQGKTLTHSRSEEVRLLLKARALPRNLDSYMRAFSRELPEAEWAQNPAYTITSQLPALAKRYSIRVQLPPRCFRVSRIVILDSSKEEFHVYTAKFRTKYLWNEDRTEVSFEDATMTTTQIGANTTYYHIARSGSHGGLTYDMRYEDHWLADAKYPFLDRLAFKELRSQGLVDCGWVKTWRLGPPRKEYN